MAADLANIYFHYRYPNRPWYGGGSNDILPFHKFTTFFSSQYSKGHVLYKRMFSTGAEFQFGMHVRGAIDPTRRQKAVSQIKANWGDGYQRYNNQVTTGISGSNLVTLIVIVGLLCCASIFVLLVEFGVNRVIFSVKEYVIIEAFRNVISVLNI